MKNRDVFARHQTKIARNTLRLTDAGASILGGMTREEARRYLKSVGWNEERIRREESK